MVNVSVAFSFVGILGRICDSALTDASAGCSCETLSDTGGVDVDTGPSALNSLDNDGLHIETYIDQVDERILGRDRSVQHRTFPRLASHAVGKGDRSSHRSVVVTCVIIVMPYFFVIQLIEKSL